jgi:hypothetical protein
LQRFANLTLKIINIKYGLLYDVVFIWRPMIE